MVQSQQLYKSSTQARPGLTQARPGLTQAQPGSSQAGHRCNFCFNNFSNIWTLEVHIKSVHAHPGLTQAPLGSSLTPQDKFMCDICDHYFPSNEFLKKHAVLNHSGQVKCEICRTPFNQIWQLTHHMAMAHPTSELLGRDSLAILEKYR